MKYENYMVTSAMKEKKAKNTVSFPQQVGVQHTSNGKVTFECRPEEGEGGTLH